MGTDALTNFILQLTLENVSLIPTFDTPPLL